MSLDQHQELKQRTKTFALRIIRMTQALPRNREANVIGRQVLRPLPASLQTTGLLAEAVQKLSLPRNSELSSKRRMKQFYSWSF